MPVKPIPDGYHSITPTMAIRGADKAVEFYKKVFGAEEVMRYAAPNGKIMHCEMKIGDSIFMFGEAVQQRVQ